jgi:hypothetical protein
MLRKNIRHILNTAPGKTCRCYIEYRLHGNPGRPGIRLPWLFSAYSNKERKTSFKSIPGKNLISL